MRVRPAHISDLTTIIDFIEEEAMEAEGRTPDRATLERILDMLGIQPRELMRKKEREYKDNNLADPSLTRDQLIDALLAHPKLIERPIVIKNGKAALGRPPEQILEILR